MFDYWADFRNFQLFIPIIERIDILDNKRSRWFIHAPLGNNVSFESFITTFEPGKKLVWESHHADGFTRGELTLTQPGENTKVELDFEYSLHQDWMQRIAQFVSNYGLLDIRF